MSNMNGSTTTTEVDWATVRNGVDVVKVGDHVHYRPKPGRNIEKSPVINLNKIPNYENVKKGGNRRTRRTRTRRSRTRSRK